MKDTAFWVPPEKIDRLPGLYAFDHRKKALAPFEDFANSEWSHPPRFESGGGGLVSTIDDCFAFCSMMLNQGHFGRIRVLSRATVALMTSDQLTPQQREGSEAFFSSNRSWGLGMAVDTARDDLFRTPGRFGWDGGCGTSAYVDPREQLVGILFTQRMMESPEPPLVFKDFWTLAYASLE
jgi:CubicO group peptidase (beta-lactamase class C family)